MRGGTGAPDIGNGDGGRSPRRGTRSATRRWRPDGCAAVILFALHLLAACCPTVTSNATAPVGADAMTATVEATASQGAAATGGDADEPDEDWCGKDFSLVDLPSVPLKDLAGTWEVRRHRLGCQWEPLPTPGWVHIHELGLVDAVGGCARCQIDYPPLYGEPVEYPQYSAERCRAGLSCRMPVQLCEALWKCTNAACAAEEQLTTRILLIAAKKAFQAGDNRGQILLGNASAPTLELGLRISLP